MHPIISLKNNLAISNTEYGITTPLLSVIKISRAEKVNAWHVKLLEIIILNLVYSPHRQLAIPVKSFSLLVCKKNRNHAKFCFDRQS